MEVHSPSDWDLPSAISPSGTESRGSREQRVQHAEHGLQRDAVWNTDLCGSPSSWSSSLGMLSSCRWICVSVWLGCGMVASARHRRHDHECRTSPGTTQPSGGPSVTLSLLRSSALDGQSQTQHKFLTWGERRKRNFDVTQSRHHPKGHGDTAPEVGQQWGPPPSGMER